MRNFCAIVKYTVFDIVHQKSFFVLLAVSIGFVMLLRGCYSGNYVVNGKALDGVTVAWHASIIAFHVVAGGVLLIASVLSMGLFRRDSDDGTASYMLSKPISRAVYAMGRVTGVWAVSFAFMFVLHLAIFIITLISAGGTMPGYLVASCACSINVLFMVLFVSVVSLYVPDFAAAIIGVGVVGISYIADSIYHVAQSKLGQAMLANHPIRVPAWETVWPKVGSLQNWAVSFVDSSVFVPLGFIHPAVIMAAWVCLAAAVLLVAWRYKEL